MQNRKKPAVRYLAIAYRDSGHALDYYDAQERERYKKEIGKSVIGTFATKDAALVAVTAHLINLRQHRRGLRILPV